MFSLVRLQAFSSQDLEAFQKSRLVVAKPEAGICESGTTTPCSLYGRPLLSIAYLGWQSQLAVKLKLTRKPLLLRSQIFFASPSGLSLAFVNLKPLVPGHVLVRLSVSQSLGACVETVWCRSRHEGWLPGSRTSLRRSCASGETEYTWMLNVASQEFDDLFRTVRLVQAVVERHYGAEAAC